MTITCAPSVNVIYTVYVNVTINKSQPNVAITFTFSFSCQRQFASDLILFTNLSAFLLRAFTFLCCGLTHSAVMQKSTICLMMSVKL